MQTDWNDGKKFCEIINKLGGNAPKPERLSNDPYSYETNIKKAVDAGQKLGVRPVLTPKDMANPDVEHLGVMTYATHLQWVTPRPPLSNLIAVQLESSSGRVGETTHFRVEVLSRDIEMHQVKSTIVAPNGTAHRVPLTNRGQGSFVPDKWGMHEIVVEVDEYGQLGGHFFRVLPRFVHVAPPGMAPCALGSLVEVLVNATGAPKSEDILVTAYSPTGRSLKCPLKRGDEGHSAIFKPDEAGVWEIAITYQGRHIQGGPFTCSVFDPNGVTVHGLDGAMPMRAHSFEIDARGCGVVGELNVDIVHEKRSLVCSVEKLVENKYRVSFMPRQNGKYRVYIYFNGYDVKGSPYIMRVGTKGRSGKSRTSAHHESNSSSSKMRSESPAMHYTTNVTSNTRRSYSPQTYSPRETTPTINNSSSSASKHHETSTYNVRERENTYSPRFDSTPPRRGSLENSHQTYSSTYRSEVKSSEHDRLDRPTPTLDTFFHEKERERGEQDLFRVKRSFDDIRTSPLGLRAGSPLETSYRVSSPVMTKTTSRYESTTTRTSSPRLLSPSSPPPIGIGSIPLRRSVSPSYVPSPVQRVYSPMMMMNSSSSNSRDQQDSRVVKESVYKSTYSSSNDSRNVYSPTTGHRPSRLATASPSDPSSVDPAPNIRVSTLKSGTRRDSWDAINKTKHLLSHNSLESLANMTESQLNTDIGSTQEPRIIRGDSLDSETHRNTQFNKFSLREKMSPSPVGSNSNRRFETSTTVNNNHGYTTKTIRETNEEYVTKRETRDGYDYGRTYSPVGIERTITGGLTGARSIVVDDIPDGVVGRPVEFKCKW